jgi:hypothetical protein
MLNAEGSDGRMPKRLAADSANYLLGRSAGFCASPQLIRQTKPRPIQAEARNNGVITFNIHHSAFSI